MGLQVNFEALRSVAHGSITNSFAAIGSALAHPARILCITNTTNATMLFSVDGTNAVLAVPGGAFKLFDFTANKFLNNADFALAKGTTIYVKYDSAPSSGSVFIEVVYGT